MIVLSKRTQDPDGTIIILEEKGTIIKDSQPRVSRVATLDGGCVIDHKGYSDSDRRLNIRAFLDETEEGQVWLLKNETLLTISMQEGVFTGVISDVRIDDGDLRLTFLIKEKISS